MKIMFTGDVFLGGDLLKYAQDPFQIVQFSHAQKIVMNLEQAVSDRPDCEEKSTIYTGSQALDRLVELGVSAVNLAHNHIQDKKPEGILDTVSALKKRGIDCFGAGENITYASLPHWLTGDVCIFGYCEYGKKYLKRVLVAEETSPGVNPLRYEKICADLALHVPEGKKAILYCHWGREHVYFPPLYDIQLAKKLLEHDKVLAVIGMHCHRAQGVLEHNGKYAFMSLGNFLFPNFYIRPPSQIYYPEQQPKKYRITRKYHRVRWITYKMWSRVNRESMIVLYDTDAQTFSYEPVYQRDKEPCVVNLQGWRRKVFLYKVAVLSFVYKQFPEVFYAILSEVNYFFIRMVWLCAIAFKHGGFMRVMQTIFRRGRRVV